VTRPQKRKTGKGEPKPNARQMAFARAYFAGPTRGNATQSARAAGYTGSDVTVRQTGSQLLTNPHVASELERLRKLAESKTIADAQETLLTLSQLQRGEVLAPIAVKSDGTIVYGPPKHGDRIRAAELRGKMLGEQRETVDVTHSGPGGGPIEHTVAIPPSVARTQLLAIYVEKFGPEEGERHVRKLLGEPEPVAIEAPKEAT
jgi:phage terminase small subunit